MCNSLDSQIFKVHRRQRPAQRLSGADKANGREEPISEAGVGRALSYGYPFLKKEIGTPLRLF